MADFDELKAQRDKIDEQIFVLGQGSRNSEKESRINSLTTEWLKINSEIRKNPRKQISELKEQRVVVSKQMTRKFNNERFDNNYFNWDEMRDQRDFASFSLGKFMREAAVDQLTGLEAEMNVEGQAEMRAVDPNGPMGKCIPARVLQSLSVRSNTGQNVGTAGDGGNLVPQSAMLYFDALRNALILPDLGATFLTGLVGSVPIVQGGLFQSQWLPEGSAVTVSKEAISKVLMQPKRLSSYAAFSKQLLKQTSLGIDQMIQNSLIYANAEAIQRAIINGLAENDQPVGILNNSGVSVVAGGADGLAPTWGNMIALESEIASYNADIGNMGYLTNAKVRGKLKATLKASNVSGYIWEGKEVNGYKAAVSNSVPSTLSKGASSSVCSAIIFGDWSKLIIGNWGGSTWLWTSSR